LRTTLGIILAAVLALGQSIAGPTDDSLNLHLLGTCAIPGSAGHLAVEGSIVCVASDSGLFVVDVSDPFAPAIVGRVATLPRATGVAVRDNYAYVTCRDSGLRVISIADPANPVQVGFRDTPYYALHVALADTFAYIGDFVAGLRIMSVANPANPYEVGFVLANRAACGVAVAGRYVYVADASMLSVIDAEDPTDPKLIGTCTTNYARYVAVVDSFAFVADAQGGMRVVNVADPTQPYTVGSYPTSFAAHVQATEGRVYLSAVTQFVTFDPTRPADPLPDGYYDMPAVASASSGDICYVTADSEGLWILKRGVAAASEPDSPSRPRVLPHATVVRGVLMLPGLGTRSELPERNSVTSCAALLDATGRKVMNLAPGENDVRHLAPGVYLFRSGPAQPVSRIVVLR